MELQNTRIILFVALFIIGFTLFGKWQQEQAKLNPPIESVTSSVTEPVAYQDVPSSVDEVAPTAVPTMPSVNVTESAHPERLVTIETPVYRVKVDKKGGDIVYAELKHYPRELDTPDSGVMLLDQNSDRFYIAQSGLIGEQGPDSRKERATYRTTQSSYQLQPGQDSLKVDLEWVNEKGVKFTKTFSFQPESYVIDVEYRVDNMSNQPWHGKFYGQVQRQFDKSDSKGGMLGMQMYQGAAVYTPDKPYKKISFDKMEEEKFEQTIKGGWAAMLEHYFLTAWLPSTDVKNDFYTKASKHSRYQIGSMSGVSVEPGQTDIVKGRFYVGPEITSDLKKIHEGLELTVDYGFLWPISQLIFAALKTIHKYVGNWGWSIILITVLIKLLFYKLSATSYRSMGHLRRVQPKIQSLKERYKDDKQAFSQAMMEIYKKEKINPLGGCLPILIQIPVFIALYYVLLESVELRQAPWILWIDDLSSKDPFYILPLVMGASMFLQQKLNPSPPDPIQAKVLMMMPVVFTVLFLSFPSGLVLYWVANNVLSILQQWMIMRSLEKEGIPRHKKT